MISSKNLDGFKMLVSHSRNEQNVEWNEEKKVFVQTFESITNKDLSFAPDEMAEGRMVFHHETPLFSKSVNSL